MKISRLIIGATLALVSTVAFCGAASAQPVDPVALVNPFMGTGVNSEATNSASVDDFPGADAPWGMLQWSPDTPNGPAASGYAYHDKANAIAGFSMTHVSGAGCGVYGEFRITPTVGAVVDPRHASMPFSHDNEIASPGYYVVKSGDPQIQTRLTVTQRSGLGEFTFPATSQANILVNTSSSQFGTTAANFHVDGPDEISGMASSGGFCGQPNTYTVYVAMKFDRPFVTHGSWSGANLSPGSDDANGPDVGGWLTFDASTNHIVKAKVAISFVSVAGARANLNAEARTWDLDAQRAATANAWRHVLGTVTVSGGTTAEQKTLYSALYHVFLHPNVFNDADGRYVGFDDKVHRVPAGHSIYANYSGWDIYRTLVPLVSLVAPHQASDMMQSLVNAQKQMGWLPRWPVANHESGVMAGDASDTILAGAYAFGARDFDTHAALRAMLKGASDTTSPPGQGWYVQRPSLDEYLKYGYVKNTHVTDVSPITNGASVTLEYIANDFSISQFAKALGDRNDYRTYLKRSQNWTKIFDRKLGLIAPRDADGALYEIPIRDIGQSGFQEGNAFQYTWMINHNLGGLVDALGGPQNTIARLDTYFTKLNTGPEQPYAWLGNEPSLGDPYVYLYAGAPAREQDVVHRTLSTIWRSDPDGMPGNDDLGTMTAWYVWNAMGLYPIDPSVRVLLLSSPAFAHVSVRPLAGNVTIDVDAPNASDSNYYVQSASVNGRQTNKAWFNLPLHGHVALSYDLGAQPSTWATSLADAPPSYGYGKLDFPATTDARIEAGSQLDLAPGAKGTLSYTVANVTGGEKVDVKVEFPADFVHDGLSFTAPQTPGLYNIFISGRTASGAIVRRAMQVVRVGHPPLAFSIAIADPAVTPFDPRTHAYGLPIPIGKRPYALALDASGKRLYVADQGSKDISVVDVDKLALIATVPVAFKRHPDYPYSGPAGIRVSPDGKSVWFTNSDNDTVQSFDVATLTPSKPIVPGRYPQGIQFSPDGKTAYVVNQADNNVVPIDVATRVVGQPIPVGRLPYNIAISRDGRMAYVSNMGEDTIGVIDLAAQRAVAKIPVGKDPAGLAISPDGRTLLVGDRGTIFVSEVDLRTNRAIASIRVGTEPWDVAFANDGKTAYAALWGDNSVVPFDLTTRRIGASLPMGTAPDALALPQSTIETATNKE